VDGGESPICRPRGGLVFGLAGWHISSMALTAFRRACEPMIRRVLHIYWRFSRGMTLGVRAAVIDGEGRVLLIKHSYVDGWHFPGGGVEPGETMLAALARELHEEGGVALDGPPALHGMFFNGRTSRRDHVGLYVARNFRQVVTPQPNFEIVDHGFFARDALPEGTTAATRARLAEIFEGRPVSENW
jgi:8-oxo-dGTP pyrophosphatase MutT (NUDIX family)